MITTRAVPTAGSANERSSYHARREVWQLLFFLLLCLWPQWLQAYSTNRPPRASQEMPRLLPPRGFMPPTFWEMHGLKVGIAGTGALIIAGLLVWRLSRARPSVPTTPETTARQALEALRGRAEDQQVATAVSHHLRRCAQAILQFPPNAWTTDELVAALALEKRLEPDLCAALVALLRECDARAFAPVPPPPQPPLVERALAIVGRLEALRATPPPPLPGPGSVPTPSPREAAPAKAGSPAA